MTEQSFPVHKDRYDALMDVVRTRMTVRAFDPDYDWTGEQIEEWISTRRHRVMYRDESNID